MEDPDLIIVIDEEETSDRLSTASATSFVSFDLKRAGCVIVPEKMQAGNSSQQVQTDDSGTGQAPHGSVEAEGKMNPEITPRAGDTSLNEFDLEVVRNLNALAVARTTRVEEPNESQ